MMKCIQCGAETAGESEYCEVCRTPVRILTPEEREEFNGVTIADDHESYHETDQQWEGGPRVYVHRIGGGLLSNLIIGVIIVALFFFVLPFALPIIFFAVITWLLSRLIRR